MHGHVSNIYQSSQPEHAPRVWVGPHHATESWASAEALLSSFGCPMACGMSIPFIDILLQKCADGCYDVVPVDYVIH